MFFYLANTKMENSIATRNSFDHTLKVNNDVSVYEAFSKYFVRRRN